MLRFRPYLHLDGQRCPQLLRPPPRDAGVSTLHRALPVVERDYTTRRRGGGAARTRLPPPTPPTADTIHRRLLERRRRPRRTYTRTRLAAGPCAGVSHCVLSIDDDLPIAPSWHQQPISSHVHTSPLRPHAGVSASASTAHSPHRVLSLDGDLPLGVEEEDGQRLCRTHAMRLRIPSARYAWDAERLSSLAPRRWGSERGWSRNTEWVRHGHEYGQHLLLRICVLLISGRGRGNISWRKYGIWTPLNERDARRAERTSGRHIRR